MSEYFEWKEFDNIYLEDSFVTGILQSDRKIVFQMEFVLTERHPLFSIPNISEKYCYKSGYISFHNVSCVHWIYKNMSCFCDVNEEIDYGNIDEMRTCGDNKYFVSGDWGEVEFISSNVEVRFS